VSNTTGDDDGIDVTIDAPADAVLRFHSPVIELEIKVSELADGRTRSFPAGGVDLRVFARRLPLRGLPASSHSSTRIRRPRADAAMRTGSASRKRTARRPGRARSTSTPEAHFRRPAVPRTLPESLAKFLEMADLCHVGLSNLSRTRR